MLDDLVGRQRHRGDHGRLGALAARLAEIDAGAKGQRTVGVDADGAGVCAVANRPGGVKRHLLSPHGQRRINNRQGVALQRPSRQDFKLHLPKQRNALPLPLTDRCPCDPERPCGRGGGPVVRHHFVKCHSAFVYQSFKSSQGQCHPRAAKLPAWVDRE